MPTSQSNKNTCLAPFLFDSSNNAKWYVFTGLCGNHFSLNVRNLSHGCPEGGGSFQIRSNVKLNSNFSETSNSFKELLNCLEVTGIRKCLIIKNNTWQVFFMPFAVDFRDGNMRTKVWHRRSYTDLSSLRDSFVSVDGFLPTSHP